MLKSLICKLFAPIANANEKRNKAKITSGLIPISRQNGNSLYIF